MIKQFKIFESYESNIENYIKQTVIGEYNELTEDLYSIICEEGFVSDLEEINEQEYDINDFEYLTLNLIDEDKHGLIDFDDKIVDKFNDFDFRLKESQMPDYPSTVDFIDYEKGIVYIIRLI